MALPVFTEKDKEKKHVMATIHSVNSRHLEHMNDNVEGKIYYQFQRYKAYDAVK